MADLTVATTAEATQASATAESIATKTVLVLGGGAPNSSLMAGALYAFDEKRVQFDIVYTSGAGALMGLLFVAPNGKSPREALLGAVESTGVSDAIYCMLPIGYKTFYKSGPFTRPLHRWGQMFKAGQFPPRRLSGYLGRREDTFKRWHSAWNDLWFRNRGNAFQRLYNDWIDLSLAALNPSDLNPFSKGLSASFPFLEDMVDFSKLDLFPGQFYMNAFNITDQRMEVFAKKDIMATPEIFRAALAMPFLYPPVEVDGKLYIEGADHDPISFGNLQTRRDNDDVKTVVVFDILSTLDDYLVREPRNVWDAYQISIMAPIVSLAGKNIAEFKNWVQKENAERQQKYNAQFDGNELAAYILDFDIPKEQRNNILDWSYSNLISLFRIGYKTGLEFVEQLNDKLSYRPEVHEPLTPVPRIFEGVGGNEQVRQAQEGLRAGGYFPGPIDGVLGNQTREALRQFQQANGLPETGEPDAATLRALGIPTP